MDIDKLRSLVDKYQDAFNLKNEAERDMRTTGEEIIDFLSTNDMVEMLQINWGKLKRIIVRG